MCPVSSNFSHGLTEESDQPGHPSSCHIAKEALK